MNDLPASRLVAARRDIDGRCRTVARPRDRPRVDDGPVEPHGLDYNAAGEHRVDL